jgi:hypothetical protein
VQTYSTNALPLARKYELLILWMPSALCSLLAASFAKPEAIEKRLKDIGGAGLSISNIDLYGESKMLLTLWTEELQARLAAGAATKRKYV